MAIIILIIPNGHSQKVFYFFIFISILKLTHLCLRGQNHLVGWYRIRTLARSPIRLKAFFWPTSRAFTRNRNPVSRTSVIGPILRFYGKIRNFSIRLGDQKTRLNWQSSRKAVKKILLLHNNFWLIGKIFQIKVFCETPLGGVSSFSGGFFKTFLPLKLKVKVWALMWASKWSKLCHKMLKNCAGKITHLILEPLIKHGGGERES